MCLDPRTMTVIEKWINNGKITTMHGCISAGKEANVYLANGNMNFDIMEPFPEGTPS
jgi:serine/threonine-protein kinase RIO1